VRIRFPQRETGERRAWTRRRGRQRRAAVGPDAMARRPVVEQQGRHPAEHNGPDPEQLERAPPAKRFDEPGATSGPTSVPSRCRPRRFRGERAPLEEPRLHRADARHIDEAHADADADRIRDVKHRERLRMRGSEQPCGEHGHAEERDPPRPETVRQRAGERADEEIEKPEIANTSDTSPRLASNSDWNAAKKPRTSRRRRI